MSVTRVLSALLLVLVLSATAVFAIEKYSDAQEARTCPADTTLSADGTACLSPGVNDNVTTTTSCTVGVLSDDGQFCIVPPLNAEPAPATPPVQAPIPTFTG